MNKSRYTDPVLNVPDVAAGRHDASIENAGLQPGEPYVGWRLVQSTTPGTRKSEHGQEAEL
jgi:hypothetical protein